MKDRLIFEKTSSEIVYGSTSCDRCDLAKLFPGTNNCEVFGCKTNENYKLIEEETKPVLSTYEHNKARYIILNSSCVFSHFSIADLKEFEREKNMLRKWLEENNPENWQTCTKENTKVGDTVRIKENKDFRVIEHFFEKGGQTYDNIEEKYYDCVANNPTGTYPSFLEGYEINIAEK